MLATFPDVFLAPSQHAVTPVLAWWPSPVPVGVVDRGEVERVLRVPVADLLAPANRFTAVFGPYKGPAFEVGDLFVWGFTAMLLSSLFELAGTAVPWDAVAGAAAARPGDVALDAGDARVSGSTALDLTLLLLLGAYAWSGWRQGFVSALLGLVGLVGGAVIAVRFVPGLLEDHAGIYQETTAGVIALLAAVVAFALLGQGLMLLLARRFRDVVTAPAARAVDSALGLLAVLVSAMLVVWVVAGAVTAAGPTVARDLVSRSVVVSALDEIVPSSADGLVEDLTQALDRSVFPKVFEGLGPEPIAPVEAPDGAVTTDPDVTRALASVVHVRAESDACEQAQVGSGWVVSRGRVATNAHVVAGADRVTVSVRGTGREHSARVVAFDPRRDVAVLDVSDLGAPAVGQGTPLVTGVAGRPGRVPRRPRAVGGRRPGA